MCDVTCVSAVQRKERCVCDVTCVSAIQRKVRCVWCDLCQLYRGKRDVCGVTCVSCTEEREMCVGLHMDHCSSVVTVIPLHTACCDP